MIVNRFCTGYYLERNACASLSSTYFDIDISSRRFDNFTVITDAAKKISCAALAISVICSTQRGE